MDFLPENIDKYVEAHTSEETDVLKRLNRDTYAGVLMPRMLSGHLQGRFLKMLTSMIQPEQVLEIGTFTGYSAICLAEGMPDGAMLHTIDINEELHDMVRKFIKEARMENKIRTYVGNAMDIIPTIQHTFDMVFIDADKTNYSNYYELVLPKLHTGGYIVADNVLWSGKVTEPATEADDETKALMAFNEKVANDPRVENVLVPIRDGLMIARKIT